MTNVVIVAPCHVPFAIGGAEKLWWGLQRHLNEHTDHQAELVKLPAPESSFHQVLASYRAFAELELTDYETIISGKYPAWMSDHPRHVLYMLHPLRGLYDTYPPGWATRCEIRHPELDPLLELVRGAELSRDALAESFDRAKALGPPAAGRRLARPPRSSVPEEAFAFPGPLIRELVHFWDRVAQRPGAITRSAAISHAVAGRADYFPEDVEVAVVHPPSDLQRFHRPRRGRHLFTVSRLDGPKRVDLLIRAMAHVPGDVELLIAGTGPEEAALRELAGGDRRIRLLGRVGDAAVLDLYAGALAVLFAPVQEDFGLVALEAMSAGKAVITTTDAGGPCELVEHGRTGFVCAPDPAAIGEHAAQLVNDRRLARAMGRRGRARAAQVSWAGVTTALVDGLGA